MNVLKEWFGAQFSNAKLAWAIVVVLAAMFGFDLTKVTPPPLDSNPPVVDVQTPLE